MSDSIEVADLSRADTELLSLILQESDKRVAAQVQLMLAVDSRSNTLLSVCATLASAAFGVAASQFVTQGFSPLVVGAATLSFVAAIAAVMAVMALKPRDVDVVGWSPRMFKNDTKRLFRRVQAEVVVQNQRKIDNNAACNKAIGRWVQATIITLSVAPFAAGLTAILSVWVVHENRASQQTADPPQVNMINISPDAVLTPRRAKPDRMAKNPHVTNP